MSTTAAKLRTLRISPRDLMTGDLLVERDTNGQLSEGIVIGIDPHRTKRGASGWRIELVGGGGGWYATQRRLTVKRQGPKGFGE